MYLACKFDRFIGVEVAALFVCRASAGGWSSAALKVLMLMQWSVRGAMRVLHLLDVACE
jgi:hypothetical protein